jgi:hypothetical protein
MGFDRDSAGIGPSLEPHLETFCAQSVPAGAGSVHKF